MENPASCEARRAQEAPREPSRSVALGRLEDASWDRFVEAHPLGWVCHLSAWQRVLEASFRHMKGEVLLIHEGGSIRAGMPIYDVRSRIFGNRLVSSPFATLCTPLTSASEDAEPLLEAALELSRSRGSRYVEVRTMRPLTVPAAGRLAQSNRFKHHQLDVDKNLEALRKRFDRSCVRQRIDRALNSGLETVAVLDEQGLRAFYGLYLQTRKRLGLPPHPYPFIRSLWATFAPSGMVEVELATWRGTPVAGILLLRFKGRVSAEYLVSDEQYRDMSPNHLLVWNAIRRAHEQGYQYFDFGRTDATNNSLMDFKRRWGTTVSDLPVYFYPRSDVAVEDKDSKLRRAAQTAFRRMPDWCNRWLGERIYNHMG